MEISIPGLEKLMLSMLDGTDRGLSEALGMVGAERAIAAQNFRALKRSDEDVYNARMAYADRLENMVRAEHRRLASAKCPLNRTRERE